MPPRLTRADAVRVALARRGWTQRDLAVALDVSPSRLNQVLTGRVNATDDWWARVALALEVPFTELGVSRAVNVARPAAELELVLYSPGRGMPTMLVPWNESDQVVAEQLGIPSQIGPGDLHELLKAC